MRHSAASGKGSANRTDLKCTISAWRACLPPRALRRLLCEYAAGSIGKIDPLDEDPLPMEKGKERGEGLLYSIWLNTAMTKPLN